MKRSVLVVFGLMMVITQSVASETLHSLEDEALGDVVAQQGIAFNLEFRINAQADGSAPPVAECPDIGVLTGGTSCRLAVSLADQDGNWIVMKGYRGIMKLSNIRIDAVNLPSSWTTHSGSGATQSINLCNAWSGTTCTGYYNPNGTPSIQLTSGPWATALAGTTTVYNTFLNTDVYKELTLAMHIDKLTYEFDGAGTPGYLRNSVTGAPISYHIANGISASNPYPSAPAQIRLDGRLQVFGY